jgi:hypothetical protein
MPDDSSRLRDRVTSEFQRRSAQVAGGSERLADRATSAFQRRIQQRARAREAISSGRDRFADALELEGDMIEPVQLDDRGEEIGFVPDPAGEAELAERFADDRPFVEPEQALVDADPRRGVETRTNPAAADEIAEQAATEFAAEDPFAEPGDFGVDVGPGGVTDARLTDRGELRRAGRQFEAETPLREVNPTRDVMRTDDGVGLTQTGQRRLAARSFESELQTFGTGELDPQSDVRTVGDGFGLAREPAREAAAAQIDRDTPSIDVGPDDIELDQTGTGRFEGTFEQEVSR